MSWHGVKLIVMAKKEEAEKMDKDLKETVEKTKKENEMIDKALDELGRMTNSNSDDTVVADDTKKRFASWRK